MDSAADGSKTADDYWPSDMGHELKGIFLIPSPDNDEYLNTQDNMSFKGGDHNIEVAKNVVKNSYVNGLIFLQQDKGYIGPQPPPNHVILTYSQISANVLGFHEAGNGFYNENGDKAIDLSAHSGAPIGNFQDGYCTVLLHNPQSNKFYTIIDSKENDIFDPISQPIGPYSGGLAIYSSNSSYPGIYNAGDDQQSNYTATYIDVHGKVALTVTGVTYAASFDENGLAMVKEKISQNGKNVCFINTKGDIAF